MTEPNRTSYPTLSRRRFLMASAASAGLMTLAVAGCAPAAAPSAPGAAPAAEEAATMGGGTMTIAYESDIIRLDPGYQQTTTDWVPSALIYSRLVEFDDTMMSPVAGAAESWTVSDDGLTYTFNLRQGVKFHSGRELTAEDVVYTFDRNFEIGSAGRFAGPMGIVESYEAVDPYTFTATLSQPDVTFMFNLSAMSASIVDKETIEQIDTNPIGTGPYTFVEWIPGERAVYRTFADYFAPEMQAVMPDEIVVTPVTEAQTRIATLQSGQADLATSIPPELLSQIEADSTLRLVSQELSASYLCLIFNMQNGPLMDNKALRQAISYAVDKDTIVRNVFFGSGSAGCSLIPDAHWAYTELDCPTYDPDRARELVAEANLPEDFKIVFRTFSDRGFGIPVAEIIQANLRDVGIEVEIEPLEWSFYVEDAWVGRNFEMTLAWYTREIDPDLLFSSVLRKEQGNNPMRYENARVDELFNQGRSTSDQEERKRIYNEIMQIAILEDVPLIKLKTMEIAWAVNDKVRNFVITPKGFPNFYTLQFAG